jgi:hypothetical protein
MTDVQLLEMVQDPMKLAQIIYVIASLDNVEEIVAEHGEEVLFRLACEVIAETEGDE